MLTSTSVPLQQVVAEGGVQALLAVANRSQLPAARKSAMRALALLLRHAGAAALLLEQGGHEVRSSGHQSQSKAPEQGCAKGLATCCKLCVACSLQGGRSRPSSSLRTHAPA